LSADVGPMFYPVESPSPSKFVSLSLYIATANLE
jgi:hypothetical protein